MSEPKRSAIQKLPSGMIACLKPGAEPLTAEEMKALDEYAKFCRERSAKRKRAAKKLREEKA